MDDVNVSPAENSSAENKVSESNETVTSQSDERSESKSENASSENYDSRPLRKLRGRPIDMSEMPESAWAEEEKGDFVRVVGIRLGEYGKVHDFVTGGRQVKLHDPVVVDIPGRGTVMGWVAKSPIRIDVSGLNFRLKEINRKADEHDLENYEKQKAMEERGYERTSSAVSRLDLPMSVLKVEYTLDRRKALVYFSSDKRVDFRILLKELVHDLKAKVELRQIGARDETKQIGGLGPCGEETCCSRFIGKFHGVSIKMAKDQGLSLKPAKVSGMCGRLKCCLAYEHATYIEGMKTVPKVGKCVKCKSGGCGTVRDVDIPRQLVLVEMDDGAMAVLPATEVFEQRTMGGRDRNREKEKVVATSDTDELVDQIKAASGAADSSESSASGSSASGQSSNAPGIEKVQSGIKGDESEESSPDSVEEGE